MKIEIFSDFACPYCYIGKKKLDEAIAQSGYENVELIYKSYQLDPDLPEDYSAPFQEYFENEYGKSPDKLIQQVTEAAQSVGLNFNYNIMKAANTRKAHRLSKWAATQGKEKEIITALMNAYFVDGKKLNDNEDLISIVKATGLNADEANKVLTSNKFDDEVSKDIYESTQLNVESVPYFLFENKYIVSGAQPVEVFINALNKANELSGDKEDLSNSDTPRCGKDGCRI